MEEEKCENPVDAEFNAAVDIVQALPKEGEVSVSNHEKLAFYSLYKQATTGPCTAGRPAFWNVVERYKWEAWNSLGDMSQKDAKLEYVKRLVAKIKGVMGKADMADLMGKGRWEEIGPALEPKFALLGCSVQANGSGSPHSLNSGVDEEKSPQSSYSSDEEFVDAPTDMRISSDTEVPSTKQTSSLESKLPQSSLNEPATNPDSRTLRLGSKSPLTIVRILSFGWRRFKALFGWLLSVIGKVKKVP